MCGRSSLTKNQKEIEERFGSTFYTDDLFRYNPFPNYNIAPTAMCPIQVGGSDKLNVFRWGLIPFWAKDIKIGYKMINARIETIREKRTYQSSIKHRRCLVPLDGFYEWKKLTNGKQPYRIQTIDQEIFCCAGMWEEWKSPDGTLIQSFTIITTPPNEMMSELHNRMPAILRREEESLWLDYNLPVKDALTIIDNPYPSDLMKAYKVSSKVGNVRENGPELIEPID